MNVNTGFTALVIGGYLASKEGEHPSTAIAIPFTLAEWKEIYDALVAYDAPPPQRDEGKGA